MALRFTILTMLLCAATCGNAAYLRKGGPTEDLRRGPTFRLFFPDIRLSRTELERISHVEVNLKCGEFGGVQSIPADWYLVTERTGSFDSRLEAYAGHGATYLWSIRPWNGAILVSVVDSQCFDVSVIVSTWSQTGDRKELKFGRRQLQLKK